MNFALQLIFDSSDEDDVPQRRPRQVKARTQHFEQMDELDFRRRFRLSKRVTLQVLDRIVEIRNTTRTGWDNLLISSLISAIGSNRLVGLVIMYNTYGRRHGC
uniref:Uncharacterized protein n=1 Tax=Lygus hesperus TaxID=30085 RepID=A0A146M9Y5_LYGHE